MTATKSDIEDTYNDVEWLGDECPQCDGELFSDYRSPTTAYERKVFCFVPGSEHRPGCGFNCWKSEYQDDVRPSGNQATLDSFGVDIDGEVDGPLLLDLPLCDHCNHNSQASPTFPICNECRDDKMAVSHGVDAVVFHGVDAVEYQDEYLDQDGTHQPKPSIKEGCSCVL